MCPACMAATAMLIASAVSTGGVAAVVVSKLLAPKGAKSFSRERESSEENIGEAADAFDGNRGEERNQEEGS